MPHANTCLWFSPEDAIKAVELYTSLIPNSRVVAEHRFESAEHPDATARTWTLEIAGTSYQVMGALYNEAFTTAHSMWLVVDDQTQLDQVWDGFLQAGGTEVQCGWLTDPFGVKWQIIPQVWEDIMRASDPAAAQRAVEAVWGMVKIDVAQLEAAARVPSASDRHTDSTPS